ncbi:rhomboid-like protein [Nocardia alni]|uniref:rhomboid-like protein n=1 Tax=Nocardia alni TaxID=2815723 RepID=UPI001C231EBE|nr:rhomboid-like protein [Nocardia alni]
MVGTLTAERAQAEVSSAIGVLRRRHWLPVTVGYILALVVVTVLWARAQPPVQGRIIAETSTNLDNLLHGRLSTLLSSAFVVGDTSLAMTAVPLMACVLALLELRFGSLRTAWTFLAGHVGATLLVAVGLWVGMARHWVPETTRIAEDVGVSYGGMALVGSLIVIVPKRQRIPWAAVWAAMAAQDVWTDRDFTSCGHFLACCIGLSIGVLMIRRGVRSEHRMNWADMLALLAAAGLAISFLMD